MNTSPGTALHHFHGIGDERAGIMNGAPRPCKQKKGGAALGFMAAHGSASSLEPDPVKVDHVRSLWLDHEELDDPDIAQIERKRVGFRCDRGEVETGDVLSGAVEPRLLIMRRLSGVPRAAA